MKSFPILLIISIVVFVISSCGRVKKGNEATVKNTTEQVSSASKSKAEADELLRQSSLEGKKEGVEEALKSGADVNAPDADGRTAIMFAGFNGHSEIVLALLDAGADIDRRDVLGRTALLYTCTGPFPETTRILLDKGAEPNIIDSNEHFTPLMHAAAEGNLDVVKILLKAGADYRKLDVDGDDAESFARQAGFDAVADYLHSL